MGRVAGCQAASEGGTYQYMFFWHFLGYLLVRYSVISVFRIQWRKRVSNAVVVYRLATDKG